MINKLIKIIKRPTAIFIGLLFLVSACIPVIRTEYLSPNWQGKLLDIKTGAPLIGITVTDLYSDISVKTDAYGYFEIPAVTTEFSFKLPVAHMTRTYKIEVTMPEHQLRFTGNAFAANTQLAKFDLGVFPIETASNSAEFYLENNGKKVQLPTKFVENCGTPLQHAISLIRSARWVKQAGDNKQNLGELQVTEKNVELAYQWANESWGYAGEVCFRNDYEQSREFSPYYQLFYQEAQDYLSSGLRFYAEEIE